MLAEFLADRGNWVQVMPGARACLFSLEESPFPLHLPLHLDHLHFETLFCQSGTMALTRRDGSALRLGARQVLLLTDLSGLAGARVDTPLAGILVAVDARGARESLETICNLLGGLILDTSRVRRWMTSRGGCAVEGPTHWSRAAFADLERLPQSEWGALVRVEVGGGCSICSPPRMNKGRTHSRVRCWTGASPSHWQRSAGIWKITWMSISPFRP